MYWFAILLLWSNTDKKQLGAEKYFISSYTLQFIIKRKQRRNSGQKPGDRNWRGYWRTLLTVLLPMTCSIWFLITPRTTCPGMDSQWERTSQMSHQSRMVMDMSTGQYDGDNSSTELPSSLVSVVLSTWKKKLINKSVWKISTSLRLNHVNTRVGKVSSMYQSWWSKCGYKEVMEDVPDYL